MSKAAELAALIGSQTALSNRNLIINGAMAVSQRSTSVTGITGGGYNTIDRMKVDLNDNGTWTHSQDTDVPSGNGFANSWKLDVTTADTAVASGSYHLFRYLFEGQDLQRLKKGTSNAESVTVSFWIKSTITGTYLAELFDNDNSRQISQSYTISIADTWEKKTLTFAGDTSGTLDDDNGSSFSLNLWFGAGSNFSSGTLNTSWASSTNANRAVGQVNAASSASNNIYLTGIQLELGEQATPFEHRSYGDELARCQRYCNALLEYGTGDTGSNRCYNADYAGNNGFVTMSYPKMREKPDLTYSIANGTISSDFSSNGYIQLMDAGDSNFYIYDVIAESEL